MMGFLERYDAAPDEMKFPLLLQTIRSTPDELFAELRQHRPILVTPSPRSVVLVTRAADVKDLLTQWTVFTVRLYAPKMDPSVGPFMLARDDTEINQRDKSVMLTLLSRSDLPAIRQIVARLCRSQLKPALKSGRIEVVERLSRGVPLRFCGAYFGFPGPDLETLARWSRATQHDMFHNIEGRPEVHATNVQAGTEMRSYLDKLIRRRRIEVRQNPGRDDTLSRLLKLELPAAVGFDSERLRTNVMGLLVGMVETCSAAVVQALNQLFDRPDALAAATEAAFADDDAVLGAHVWEALRFDPINPLLGRIAVQPYTIGAGSDSATTVAPGVVVLAATRSALHDPAMVADPDSFRADRPGWLFNMHFGYGPHWCLGGHIAQVMVPEIVKHILRLPELRRAEEAAGQPDFRDGPFPESWPLLFARARRR